MTYLRNPVYLGVGALDRADRNAVFAKETQLRETYKQAYASLANMSPSQLEAVVNRLNVALASLPTDQKQNVVATGKALAKSDLRAVTGLGQAAVGTAVQAADWSTKLANIAGVIASVATVGVGIATFIEGRKQSKEQAALQERQQKMLEDQTNADIAAKKAALEAAKGQTSALTQQAQLDAAGYMMTADGQIVPKPKNTALTVGAIAAAAVGAFFMSK